jgi:hypothetical protein
LTTALAVDTSLQRLNQVMLPWPRSSNAWAEAIYFAAHHRRRPNSGDLGLYAEECSGLLTLPAYFYRDGPAWRSP